MDTVLMHHPDKGEIHVTPDRVSWWERLGYTPGAGANLVIPGIARVEDVQNVARQVQTLVATAGEAITESADDRAELHTKVDVIGSMVKDDVMPVVASLQQDVTGSAKKPTPRTDALEATAAQHGAVLTGLVQRLSVLEARPAFTQQPAPTPLPTGAVGNITNLLGLTRDRINTLIADGIKGGWYRQA